MYKICYSLFFGDAVEIIKGNFVQHITFGCFAICPVFFLMFTFLIVQWCPGTDRSVRVDAMRAAICETFPEPNRRLLQR